MHIHKPNSLAKRSEKMAGILVDINISKCLKARLKKTKLFKPEINKNGSGIIGPVQILI